MTEDLNELLLPSTIEGTVGNSLHDGDEGENMVVSVAWEVDQILNEASHYRLLPFRAHVLTSKVDVGDILRYSRSRTSALLDATLADSGDAEKVDGESSQVVLRSQWISHSSWCHVAIALEESHCALYMNGILQQDIEMGNGSRKLFSSGGKSRARGKNNLNISLGDARVASMTVHTCALGHERVIHDMQQQQQQVSTASSSSSSSLPLYPWQRHHI